MHPKYQEVIKLRKMGKSYREIAKAVLISKNSVSRWYNGLKLPKRARDIIYRKNKNNREFFALYNKQRHQSVQAENRKILELSAKEIKNLSNYELKLIGAALYWGEGYKKQEHFSSPNVRFVNSDPLMIKIFLKFLFDVMSISKERIRVGIRIHPNIKEKTAIEFWSNVTAIDKSKFKITRQVSRASQGKMPKNSLPYGTLDITVSGRRDFYKIKGWINGLAQNVI